MAALSADLEHCTKYQSIIFEVVKVNRRGGYNNTNGIFTAPVSGIYSFSTTLSVMENNEYRVELVKGNVTNAIGYMYSMGRNDWQQRSTTVLTHLKNFVTYGFVRLA